MGFGFQLGSYSLKLNEIKRLIYTIDKVRGRWKGQSFVIAILAKVRIDTRIPQNVIVNTL